MQNHSTSTLGGFAAAIRLTIDKNGLGEHLRPHQAIMLWPEVAGERIASVAEADAVRGGVLFVKAKSSVWANELTFYKPDLLAKLNVRLGGKIIDDIHFSTGTRSKTRACAGAKTTVLVEVRDLSRIAPPLPITTDPAAKLEGLVARTKAVIAWKRENGWIECGRCRALFEPEKPAKGKHGVRRAAGDGWCPVCRALTKR